MDKARTRELRRSLLALYEWSWAAKSYARIKLVLLPLREISEELPKQGVILDTGCGFGYVANYLNLDSPELVIVANDPVASRVTSAQRTIGFRRNMELCAIDSRDSERANFDGASVVDALHHVPYDQQQALIDDRYRKLKPGGLLVFRETDQRYGLRDYLFNCALEWLLYAGQEKTRFRPKREWMEMLQRPGFHSEQVVPNTWWFPYTTCLFFSRKAHHD